MSSQIWKRHVSQRQMAQHRTSEVMQAGGHKELRVHSSADDVPTAVSVHVDVGVSVGAPPEVPDFQLLSVERLLPAREHLHDAFNCYDKDGNQVIHGELEMQGLQRHVAALVSSDDVARQLMKEAGFRRGGDGLDEVEFGTLLDLICFHLKIKICATLDSGRNFTCEGKGPGSLLMFGSFEKLADAHADLDVSFRCFDSDGDSKLSKKELDELIEHLKTGLHFSLDLVSDALQASSWGDDGYCELQSVCLMMLLQEAVEKLKLDVNTK